MRTALAVAALVALALPLAGATDTPPMPNAPPAFDAPPDRGCADVAECYGWTMVRVGWGATYAVRVVDYGIDESLRQTTWADATARHVANCHVLGAFSCGETVTAGTPAGTVYVPVGLSPSVWREANGCPGLQTGDGCDGRGSDERVL